MFDSGGRQNKNWREQIKEIAARWFFSDHGQPPSSVVLPLENPDLHERELFEARLVDVVQARSITVGTYRGRRIGVMRSKFGAPAVALTAETLAHVGVKSIVAVGFCGGLQPHVTSGDLIVPLSCVRDEGTSLRYVPAAYPAVADPDISSMVAGRLMETGHRFHRGIVWTTDAILMETTEAVKEWSAWRVLAVDMESAALFTVSYLAGIKAAAVLVVSDHPVLGELANDERVRQAHDFAVSIALEVAADLSPPDPA